MVDWLNMIDPNDEYGIQDVLDVEKWQGYDVYYLAPDGDISYFVFNKKEYDEFFSRPLHDKEDYNIDHYKGYYFVN